MRTLRSNPVMCAALLATVGLAACSKTDDGQLQVKVPEVDVKVRTDTVQAPNLPSVELGTKRDTITTPTVGTKRTEVQRPTVDTKRPWPFTLLAGDGRRGYTSYRSRPRRARAL